MGFLQRIALLDARVWDLAPASGWGGGLLTCSPAVPGLACRSTGAPTRSTASSTEHFLHPGGARGHPLPFTFPNALGIATTWNAHSISRGRVIGREMRAWNLTAPRTLDLLGPYD